MELIGKKVVSPAETTTYTPTAENKAGNTYDTAQVTVGEISTWANSVGNLSIVDNPNSILITVDYEFLSENGDVARIVTTPLRNGEFPSDYFSYSTEIILKGKGTVNLSILFIPKGTVSTFQTCQLEFVMWNTDYGTFCTVLFKHQKS